jgi:hypothetical protein
MSKQNPGVNPRDPGEPTPRDIPEEEAIQMIRSWEHQGKAPTDQEARKAFAAVKAKSSTRTNLAIVPEARRYIVAQREKGS